MSSISSSPQEEVGESGGVSYRFGGDFLSDTYPDVS